MKPEIVLYRRTVRRFCRSLYHQCDATAARLFRIGLKSLSFEIVKILVGTARLRPSRVPADALVIESTGNQRRALGAAARAGAFGSPVNIYAVDARFNAELLLSSAWALLRYPFAFLQAPRLRRRFLHERLLHPLRVRSIRRLLARRRWSDLTVSNDHQGTVFALATLASLDGVRTSYVQHGMIQPAFPRNDFHALYVWDQRSADLYRTLCRRPGAEIRIVDWQRANAATPAHSGHILIVLSHPFPVFTLLRALWLMRRVTAPAVVVRFHPSDRLAALKLALLRTAHWNLDRELADVPFIASFARCALALVASSSVLVEAAQHDRSRVVWVKPFGLPWDYYNLASKVEVVEDVGTLARLFEARALRTRPA